MLVFDLDAGAWDIPELRRLLLEVLVNNSEFNDFAIEHPFEGRGTVNMLLNARRLEPREERQSLILLSIEDVSDGVAADDLRNLLIRELGHRVKNTLAMVQSIASQTLRQSQSLAGFKAAFVGRLHALGRAHDLLVEDKWAGSSIVQLVQRTLEPYGLGARATIDGPAIVLKPQATVALALILHELATNAVKYGALKGAGGRIAVSWQLAGEAPGALVDLIWAETPDFPVGLPTRQGFGTQLVERSAAHELHGSARIDYRPEGLHCAIQFPLASNAAETRWELV